jgi:hypothetical protein
MSQLREAEQQSSQNSLSHVFPARVEHRGNSRGNGKLGECNNHFLGQHILLLMLIQLNAVKQQLVYNCSLSPGSFRFLASVCVCVCVCVCVYLAR